MVAWLKVLLFVGGGATAAAGAAYVTGMLDPWLGRPPAVVAALPEAPAPRQPQQETPAASEDVPLPDDPVTAERQDRLVVPSFDLLRVEPDGSVLIAGKAAPEAAVEVLSGDTVLAGTTAGADGDFVIVLDDALPPGDHVLTLRATAAGGDVVMSSETAIVSIPEAPDGQVLAMVEEPGQPSELVTVPEAAADEPAQPAGAEEIAAAGEAVEEEAAGAPAAAQPEEAEELAEAPDETAAETEADVAEGPAAAPGEAAAEAEAGPAGEEVAAAAPAEEEARPQPAADPRVVVEAVEIEGDTIFVAGHADPGRTVRVYADALLLGDAVASGAGRFLVEARRELAVGNYVIRADLLAGDGSVLARAAVPFEREPGESIAAVAAAPEPEPGPEAVEEEVAAAAEPEPEAVEEEIVAAPEPEPASEAVEEEIAAAEPEPVSEAVEEEVAAAPAPEAAAEAAGEEAAGEPAGSGDEVAVAGPPAQAAEDEAEITAPPLQRVDGAVIIRRGDTLWRISRRVYGQGARYSTIYLANQDQIRDPDRIWPGQVFAVPQQTPEGEAANMDAIAEQVVEPGEAVAR